MAAKDEAAGRLEALPESNAARRASTSTSHAASTSSSNSSGLNVTRSRRRNSCRSAADRVTAPARRASTRLAMASLPFPGLSLRGRHPQDTPGTALPQGHPLSPQEEATQALWESQSLETSQAHELLLEPVHFALPGQGLELVPGHQAVEVACGGARGLQFGENLAHRLDRGEQGR